MPIRDENRVVMKVKDHGVWKSNLVSTDDGTTFTQKTNFILPVHQAPAQEIKITDGPKSRTISVELTKAQTKYGTLVAQVSDISRLPIAAPSLETPVENITAAISDE